ncbi:MAG: sensor histidine kinase [Christensenellaceae bacterium]|nr:sensor histidine kinase [Christensenellaceae bacterium]
MRDISLHVLDLVQNSITANASLIQLRFEYFDNNLIFKIIDDGKGMGEELINNVKSPFTTGRTTRKVGLGIPLLLANAELSGGYVDIKSTLGKGTELIACFKTDNIDCLPLGDMIGTFITLIITNPYSPEFVFSIKNSDDEFEFDTREVKTVLAGVPINEPDIIKWIDDTLKEEMQPLFGGI